MELHPHDKELTELFNVHYKRIRSSLLHRGCDPGDVDDIVQDMFFRMIRSFSNIRNERENSLPAWMHKTVRSTWMDFLRKEKTRRLEFCDPEELLTLKHSPFEDPEKGNKAVVSTASIEYILSLVDPDVRPLFVDRYCEHLSFKVIAERHGLKEVQTRVRVHRARNKLRKELAPVR